MKTRPMRNSESLFSTIQWWTLTVDKICFSLGSSSHPLLEIISSLIPHANYLHALLKNTNKPPSVMVKILLGILLKLFFSFLFELSRRFSWTGDWSSFRPSDNTAAPGATFHINCHHHYHILYYLCLINMRKEETGIFPVLCFLCLGVIPRERCTLSFLLDTRGGRALMRSRRTGRKARLVSVNTLLILLPFFRPPFPLISSLSISLKSARAPAEACRRSGLAGILRSPLGRYCGRELRARHSHCLERCSAPAPATWRQVFSTIHRAIIE